MAMHVHASFSEKFGSMNAHLSEATRHGVDVIWWTEHDTKMNGVTDKHVVHFTSLTNETGDGTPWRWQQRRTGSLTSASTGGIVSTPASPSDPVAGGSLHVTAQSTGAAKASLSYEPSPDYPSWRTNLADQTISIEVLPTSVGGNAYLELFIGSSHHPAAGGRPAGRYSLSYRIGGRQLREAGLPRACRASSRCPRPSGRGTRSRCVQTETWRRCSRSWTRGISPFTSFAWAPPAPAR